MDAVLFDPMAGTHIATACSEAIDLARKRNRPVRFRFNGIRVHVTKRLSVRHLTRQWEEQSKARSTRYRSSPEGMKRKKERDEQVKARQKAVDVLLSVLPMMKSGDAQMEWLKGFTENADDKDVTFDKEALVNRLEYMGFSESQHVGQPLEFFRAPRNLCEYIFGQAINCLRNGMPPHPVTLRFVDDYFNLVNEKL